jgi:hypothetical protein
MPGTLAHLTFPIDWIEGTLERHFGGDRIHHHDASDLKVQKMAAENRGAELDGQISQAAVEASHGVLHVMKQLVFVMCARRVLRVQIGNTVAEDATLQLGILFKAIVFYAPRVEQPLQIPSYRVLVSPYRFPALRFVGVSTKLPAGVDIGRVVVIGFVLAEPINQRWSGEAVDVRNRHGCLRKIKLVQTAKLQPVRAGTTDCRHVRAPADLL